MKSKIRVEYDFDKKEPYIQFYLEKDSEGEPDLRDGMLKSLIQSASFNPIWIWYPPHNSDNSVPQIRLQDPHAFVTFMEDWCLTKFNQDNSPKAEGDEMDLSTREINNFFSKITRLL